MSNTVRLVSASDITAQKKRQGTTERYNAMKEQNILPIGGIPFADLYDIAHATSCFQPAGTIFECPVFIPTSIPSSIPPIRNRSIQMDTTTNTVRLTSASDVTTRKKQQGTTERYNEMQQQNILPIGGIPFADLYDIAHTSTVYTDQTTACIPCEGNVNFVLRQYKPIPSPSSCDPNAWLDTPTNKFAMAGYGVIYGGGIWVAVGEATIPIKHSLDGITWTDANISIVPYFHVGNDVAYGGGRWVAVGTDSTIVRSFDTVNWTVPPGLVGFDDIGNRVAYGMVGGSPGFIAVGADSGGKTIKYSNDGVGGSWTDVTSGAFSTSGNGIAYSDGLWVAVGTDSGGNTIKWSYDGLIWNNSITGAFIGGIDVAYNNGLWIAVGDDAIATIKGSLDGQYWIDLLSGTDVKYSVAYGDGRWIVGGLNTIIYSDNSGGSWSSMTNAFSGIAYGSAYGDGKWVAVGVDVDSAGKTIKVIECPASIPPTAPLVTDVAVGDGDTILVSYNNGVNWTHTGISGEFTLTGTGVGYGLVAGFPGWVATGVIGGNNPILAYSNDGLNWTFGTGTTFDVSANSVVFNGVGWLALGSGFSNKILKSADGIDWSPIAESVFTYSGNQAAWDGTKWNAVGQAQTSGYDTMFTTTDPTGNTGWTPVPSGLFTTKGNGIAFNGSRWIAVGKGDGYKMKTSTDGTTWTVSGISGFNTTEGKQVAFNGYYWIAVGLGGFIYKSTDGLAWTSHNSVQTNTYTIIWNGLYWIAGGDGTSTIVISQDGETWTSASGTLFADVALGVCPRKTLLPPPCTFNFIQRSVPGPPPTRLWTGIASSGDGVFLAAIAGLEVFISSDSGLSWTNTSPVGSDPWTSITMDSSGQYMAVCRTTSINSPPLLGGSGEIYVSSDSGLNWSLIGGSPPPDYPWTSISYTSDGSYLVAGATNQSEIYYSSDNGTSTWVPATSIPNVNQQNWLGIATISSGFGGVGIVSGGGVWIFGGVQMQDISSGAGENWRAVACNNNCSVIFVVSSADHIIKRSTNSGSTWTTVTPAPSLNWSGISVSPDGTKIFACAEGGQLYRSTDTGATWIPLDSSRQWTGVASSSDGEKLAAVNYGTLPDGGYIYTGACT